MVAPPSGRKKQTKQIYRRNRSHDSAPILIAEYFLAIRTGGVMDCQRWFDDVEDPFREGRIPLNADAFVVASKPELVRNDAASPAERFHVSVTELARRAHTLRG